VAHSCADGTVTPIGLITTPVPEVVYNDKGYLGVFNFEDERRTMTLPLSEVLRELLHGAKSVRDLWTGEEWSLEKPSLELGEVEAHGSRLFVVSR